MPRQHKGTRLRLNLRVPVDTYAAISRAALRAGQDVNSWCNQVLTKASQQ